MNKVGINKEIKQINKPQPSKWFSLSHFPDPPMQKASTVLFPEAINIVYLYFHYFPVTQLLSPVRITLPLLLAYKSVKDFTVF